MADSVVVDEKIGAAGQPAGKSRVPMVFADASWDAGLNGYTAIANGEEVTTISYGVNAFNNVASALAALRVVLRLPRVLPGSRPRGER